MVTVKYEDLSLAFDFVSSAPPTEHEAYISLDTGAIYWVSDMDDLDDDIPDDLETSDRYLAVPHKHDLDLGNQLALEFVKRELPDQFSSARAIFQHRGAYARFKVSRARYPAGMFSIASVTNTIVLSSSAGC